MQVTYSVLTGERIPLEVSGGRKGPTILDLWNRAGVLELARENCVVDLNGARVDWSHHVQPGDHVHFSARVLVLARA